MTTLFGYDHGVFFLLYLCYVVELCGGGGGGGGGNNGRWVHCVSR